MKTADFYYELPAELIAQTPIEPRDASRLMVVDRNTQQITHRHFYDLPELLDSGDMLVLNQTKVIPARLFARKPTGGKVEILLLRLRQNGTWETLIKGKHTREGLQLDLLDGKNGQPVGVRARIVGSGDRGLRVVAFDREILPLAERIGTIPLPPYIHTPLSNNDRYQTIYARSPGAVAAPTAGLHFTPRTLLSLRERGVQSSFATLHVGLDTFRPVSEENLEEHEIHTEYCMLQMEEAGRINQTRLASHRVVAVGTTSVRVLETAARAAAAGAEDEDSCPMQTVTAYEGATDLFIYPGFQFRAVDALITNFHLPRSTLLMLVAAFAGKDVIDLAYAEAIRQHYRFYSLGDAMLIL